MNITPLFDNVVLKIENANELDSGIIIPTNKNEKPYMAKVVAIGTGGTIDGEKVEFKVKPNDKVIFNKYATTQFVFNNETFYLIKQIDILAIIN